MEGLEGKTFPKVDLLQKTGEYFKICLLHTLKKDKFELRQEETILSAKLKCLLEQENSKFDTVDCHIIENGKKFEK